DSYLKGRYLWNRRSDQDLYVAVRYFEKAIAVDAAYAPAYTGIADCYLTRMDHGHISLAEATEKARPLLAKALQLDDSSAEAHTSVAHCAFHEYDWATAE